MMEHRNLFGHGEHPADAEWPDGARAGYWRIARVLRKHDATRTLDIRAKARRR